MSAVAAATGLDGAGESAPLQQLHRALEHARQTYRQHYQQLHDLRTEERALRGEVRAWKKRSIPGLESFALEGGSGVLLSCNSPLACIPSGD